MANRRFDVRAQVRVAVELEDDHVLGPVILGRPFDPPAEQPGKFRRLLPDAFEPRLEGRLAARLHPPGDHHRHALVV
jgi:hypothetical protein